MKIIINMFLLLISFSAPSNLSAQNNKLKSPESIFLNEIITLSKQYGHSKIPLYSGPYKPVTSEERENEILKYKFGLPKIWLMLQSLITNFLKLNSQFKHRDLIESYLINEPPINPRKLLNLFQPLISNKKFTIQSGDMIMIMPHSYDSLIRSYMMDSAYSHTDMIYVDENNIPFVFNITPYGVIKISLARYLCGYFLHIQNFAIYRYNDKIDKQKLQTLLDKVDKNIHNLYFDEAFKRDTTIKNINTFMEKPTFYYCSELSYSIFDYTLKGKEFATQEYTSVKQMIKNRGSIPTPFQDFIINSAEKMETEQKQWIIDPRNFYESKKFSPLIIYGNNISIKELFDKTD